MLYSASSVSSSWTIGAIRLRFIETLLTTPLSKVFFTTGDTPLTISLCVERSYFELIDRQPL
jgi:hypothetical protein